MSVTGFFRFLKGLVLVSISSVWRNQLLGFKSAMSTNSKLQIFSHMLSGMGKREEVVAAVFAF